MFSTCGLVTIFFTSLSGTNVRMADAGIGFDEGSRPLSASGSIDFLFGGTEIKTRVKLSISEEKHCVTHFLSMTT